MVIITVQDCMLIFGEIVGASDMESHKRTLIRTLSYRFTALLITAVWTGLGDAIAIHVVLAIWQYALERIWLKINWGK